MNRRTAWQTTAVALLGGVAGCLSDATSDENESTTETDDSDENESTDETDDSTTTETETDMIDNDRVDESTFTRTGTCEAAGTATIEFADTEPEATITGCVMGHNGCAEPVVESVRDEDETFHFVIGEADLSDSETICTEALVQRGYELQLSFVPELPATIEVVHDDVDGRAVVATADRP